MGNCSLKISKEHHISAGILKKLSKKNTAKIAGSKSIPLNINRFQIFGIGSLASKILCLSHNSELSELDEEAIRLFENIDIFDKDRVGGLKVNINGGKIERWILKLAFGAIASGACNSKLKMQPHCLDILFDKGRLPKGQGLYVQSNTLHTTNFDFQLKHNPKTMEVLLIEVNMGFLRLNLVLGNPNTPTSFGIFRPHPIILNNPKIPNSFLGIHWDNQTTSTFIEFKRVGSHQGNIPTHWPSWSHDR